MSDPGGAAPTTPLILTSPPLPTPRAPLWVPIAAGLLAAPLLVFFVGPTLGWSAALVLSLEEDWGTPRHTELYYAFFDSPLGSNLWIIGAEGCLLVLALLAALVAGRPYHHRLGLVRPSLPASIPLLAPLLIFGTAAAQGIGAWGAWLLSWVGLGNPEQLEHQAALTQSHSLPALLTGLFLSSLLPGLCEELLFRGVIQRALLDRWRPLYALLFSTLAFGAIHHDPYHIIGTLPIGLWFGYIAWRTCSILPTVILHILTNIWTTLLWSSGITDPETYSTISPAAAWGLWLVYQVPNFLGLAAIPAAVILFERAARRGTPPPQPAP